MIINYFFILFYYFNIIRLCEGYGVDVSFPIHHKIDLKTYQVKN